MGIHHTRPALFLPRIVLLHHRQMCTGNGLHLFVPTVQKIMKIRQAERGSCCSFIISRDHAIPSRRASVPGSLRQLRIPAFPPNAMAFRGQESSAIQSIRFRSPIRSMRKKRMRHPGRRSHIHYVSMRYGPHAYHTDCHGKCQIERTDRQND